MIPSPYSLGSLKIIQPYSEETSTGVKPEERIVISNLQRAREGLIVKPIEPAGANPAAEPAPAGAPTAGASEEVAPAE